MGSIMCNMDENEFQFGNRNIFRYLKGAHPKRNRLENLLNWMTEDEDPNAKRIRNILLDGYEKATPFSHKEAFNLKDANFRAIVFGSIDIRDMIAEMGHERIRVDGMPVKQKVFAPNGEFLGMREKDNIYELHKVNGEKLGIQEDIFAVKCWCTSTDKEHWIWVEPEYTQDALTAIASTFRVHENMIPHIKEIKRQGDILILEMNKEVKPEGDIVPLTKEQYFGLLTAES